MSAKIKALLERAPKLYDRRRTRAMAPITETQDDLLTVLRICMTHGARDPVSHELLELLRKFYLAPAPELFEQMRELTNERAALVLLYNQLGNIRESYPFALDLLRRAGGLGLRSEDPGYLKLERGLANWAVAERLRLDDARAARNARKLRGPRKTRTAAR